MKDDRETSISRKELEPVLRKSGYETISFQPGNLEDDYWIHLRKVIRE